MTPEGSIAVVVPLGVLYLIRVAVHTRFIRFRKGGVCVGGRGSVMLFGLLFLLIVVLLVWRGPELRLTVRSVFGLFVIAVAFLMRAAALARLGGHYSEAIVVHSAHNVVTDGIYRRLRHPLHLSLLFEIAGLGLVAGSSLAIPLVAVFMVVVVHRNVHEESALLRELGPAYARYLEGPAYDIIDLLPRQAKRWLSGSQ